MFTADEYRIAAAVLRSVGTSDPTAVPTLEAKAESVEKRQMYANAIGMIGITSTPETRGSVILSTLLKDGWRKPDGLF